MWADLVYLVYINITDHYTCDFISGEQIDRSKKKFLHKKAAFFPSHLTKYVYQPSFLLKNCE